MAEQYDLNQELARQAVARGMASRAQVDECLRSCREPGRASESLADALARRGYITPVQRDALAMSAAAPSPAQASSPFPVPFQPAAQYQPPSQEYQVVGGYQLIKMIGRGGMGSVYRARQMSLDRLVALKILNRNLGSNPSYRQRFLREARAAGVFNHPNIVRAIDAGEYNGDLYFAMELVDGKNVSAHLREEGPFAEQRAISVARQIGLALSHAWKHRFVHRDIKPENILIDRDGLAKLADLGLAKLTEGEDRQITQAGMAMGTPYYISPEQIRLVDDLDVRADIYSLGATLFHMVTGRTPFVAESPPAVVSMHLSSPVPDPRQFNPGLSPGLVAVIMKCMAKDRNQRYQTPEELVSALDGAASAGRQADGAIPAIERQQEPQGVGFGTVMGIVTLMALAALIYFLVFHPSGRSGDDTAGWEMQPDPSAQPAAQPEPEPRPKQPVKGSDTKKPPVQPARAPEHEQKLIEAEKFIDENPEDYARILSVLEAVVRGYPDTTSSMLAAKKLEAITRALDDAARKSLHDPQDGIEARAHRLLESRRFKEGLSQYDSFPANLRAGGWEEKLEASRKSFLDEGRTRVMKGVRKAREMASRSRYSEALQILQDVSALEVPGFESQLEKETARLRGLMDQRLFNEFAAGLLEASGRDLLEAEEYLSRYARDERSGAALKDDIKAAKALVDGARAVLSGRDEAMAALGGFETVIGLKDGRRLTGVVKQPYSPERAQIVLSGIEGGVSHNFDPADIAVTTLHSLCKMGRDEGWQAIAAFQLLDFGDFEAARQAMDFARGGERAFFDRFAGAAEEVRIAELLSRAENTLTRNPDAASNALETILAKHRDAPAARAAQERIYSMYRSAATAAGRPNPDLQISIAGRVGEASEGKVRILWNFESRLQEKDLKGNHGFRVLDGALTHERQSSDKESTAFFPMQWGNFTVECEFKAEPGVEFLGIVFHYLGMGDFACYRVFPGLAGGKATAGFAESQLGRTSFEVKDLAVIDVGPFDMRHQHRIKLIIEGDRFRGILDGKVVGPITRQRFSRGQVGLVASGPCSFRDFKIIGVSE